MSKLYVKSIDKCIQCPACITECISFSLVRLSCNLWEDSDESNIIGDCCMYKEEDVKIPSWCKLEVIE